MGSGIKRENKELNKLLNAEGVMCVISAGAKYDKLKTTNNGTSGCLSRNF
ncbi:hypothetical protein B0I21_10480 [Sphingobacterium paludis]|uniref:Uncharacterized protein n=1 Tax=Sphingobacterium paludis TaxID=1476465 RepID=A0A4R7D2F0_9SPHI|nr:hypothetical protein B0I21_10480 [Sphingobacterium paludis]